MRTVGSGIFLVAFILLGTRGVAQAAKSVEEQRLCVSVVVEQGRCYYDQVYQPDGLIVERCSEVQASCPADYPFHQRTTITQPCGDFSLSSWCRNSRWSGSIECCNQPPQPSVEPRPAPGVEGGDDGEIDGIDRREFFP